MNTTDKLKIDLVIERFYFEKVEAAMHALNWGWASKEDPNILKIPTIEDLRICARHVLEVARKRTYCSTGGFTGTYDGEFHLEFVLEQQDSEI